MKRLITLLSAGLAVIAFGCATETEAADGVGSLSLELVIAPGVVVAEVDWEITNGGEAQSGTIDVSAPGSTASIEVFGLAPGPHVIEMVAISVNGQVTCVGSAPFDVEIGVATDVMVFLNCNLPESFGGVRANGDFNICANLERVVVSPLQTSVGNDIDLSAQATDAEDDSIQYLWTTLSGSIADPSAPNTTYTCEEIGDHDITITVSDDDFDWCNDSWTVYVTCVLGG